MANICETTITIRTKDVNGAMDFVNACECNVPIVQLLKPAGFDTQDPDIFPEGCTYRSHIADIDFDAGGKEIEITLRNWDAWSPVLHPYELLAGKFLPDCEMDYDAIELNERICESSNPDKIGKYIVEVYGDEAVLGESMRNISEDQLIKHLQEKLKTNASTIDDLKKLIDEQNLGCIILRISQGDEISPITEATKTNTK